MEIDLQLNDVDHWGNMTFRTFTLKGIGKTMAALLYFVGEKLRSREVKGPGLS